MKQSLKKLKSLVEVRRGCTFHTWPDDMALRRKNTDYFKPCSTAGFMALSPCDEIKGHYISYDFDAQEWQRVSEKAPRLVGKYFNPYVHNIVILRPFQIKTSIE